VTVTTRPEVASHSQLSGTQQQSNGLHAGGHAAATWPDELNGHVFLDEYNRVSGISCFLKPWLEPYTAPLLQTHTFNAGLENNG
jgi:hypothetical protein